MIAAVGQIHTHMHKHMHALTHTQSGRRLLLPDSPVKGRHVGC